MMHTPREASNNAHTTSTRFKPATLPRLANRITRRVARDVAGIELEVDRCSLHASRGDAAPLHVSGLSHFLGRGDLARRIALRRQNRTAAVCTFAGSRGFRAFSARRFALSTPLNLATRERSGRAPGGSATELRLSAGASSSPRLSRFPAPRVSYVERPIAPLASGRHAGQSHVHAARPLPRLAWSIHPAAVAAFLASSMLATSSALTAPHVAHDTDHAPPFVSRSMRDEA